MLRWFAWSFNCFYWLFVSAIVGPLGIRALLGCSEFHPDVCIDSRTGVVGPSDYTVQTVVSTFGLVLDGMMKSRDDFESRPDTGFFGKNVSRLWNLI